MLRGNLSTRPFYNERAVQVLLALAAVALVALTVYSATQFFSLSRQQAQLSARIGADDRQAQALQREAEQVRRSIDAAELDATVQATREVNRAIDQRVFSWTALFNAIEQTIPATVTLRAVRPTVGDEGGVTVRLLVNAQQIEDVGAFMDRLEQAQSFTGMRSMDEHRADDGSYLVTVDGRYLGPSGQAADAPGPADAASAEGAGGE